MAHEALRMTEFSDQPAVLLVADGEAAEARARRSSELAGFRVKDAVRIEQALARVEAQAGLEPVFVELDADHGEPLDRLLDHLEERASVRGAGSIVAAPLEMVDAVVARVEHPLVQLLCGAGEMERVATIAFAGAPRKHMLNDAGRDRAHPRLKEVSQEVARIAAVLATLAEEEGRAERVLVSGDISAGAPEPMDAGAVRAMIRARRLREHYFGPDLFADPAWDILLDLYAARLEQQRVAVSSLCIAAAVPPTTALRWIKTLTDTGLLVRRADPQDGRRVYIELAETAAKGLEAYFSAAHRISPLVL
jgi:DNA-binding MarR family transcriptional regulator